MSLFSAVEMAPRDPILGLNEQFNADTNPSKVNLGVGVYFDDNGKLPLLKCVQTAEATLMAKPTPRGYLPIDGIAAYDAAVKGLVFGAESEVVKSGRVATVQAIGGTGGLKIGADFLKKISPHATVLISDPSWENHRALFTNAGFSVDTYPYFDQSANGGLGGINFTGMLAALNAAAAGTIVLLHNTISSSAHWRARSWSPPAASRTCRSTMRARIWANWPRLNPPRAPSAGRN